MPTNDMLRIAIEKICRAHNSCRVRILSFGLMVRMTVLMNALKDMKNVQKTIVNLERESEIDNYVHQSTT